MHALVVYESMFANTRVVAETVAQAAMLDRRPPGLSFRMDTTTDPPFDGEVEHARRWGGELGAQRIRRVR
jgi:hypothetical protein